MTNTAAVGVLSAIVLACASGCDTVGYYARAVSGHLQLVGAARPLADVLADPQTDARLRERLLLAQRIRDFASAELGEPDNASYRRYADLGRSAAVWNVVAAPALGLELKTWCFAVVGCVGYRGYYDRAEADAFAAALRRDGLDAMVYPVAAYSTLGKLPFDRFADPLLNTFIGGSEADLARLVFHELAHQIAFAPGDTEFNESFATAVETIGVEKWLGERAAPGAREADAAARERRADFRALTARYRNELAALYASPLDDAAKRGEKEAVFGRLRADHAALKRERWNGDASYDGWIARANNASFAIQSSYVALAPAFRRLWEREGRDFDRFYAEVKRLAALPKAERRAALGAAE